MNECILVTYLNCQAVVVYNKRISIEINSNDITYLFLPLQIPDTNLFDNTNII